MPQTLILAKTIREANQYARLAGLQRYSYRAVQKAGSIRGVRNAEVHLLPSFLQRFDKHAILLALRSARTLEIFYVDPADFVEPEYVVDLERKSSRVQLNSLEARPELSDELLDLAYRFHAIYLSGGLSEPTGTTEPSEDAAPADEPKSRTRRSRCKICQQLVIGSNDPAHDGAAHDARTADLPTPPPAPRAPDDFFG